MQQPIYMYRTQDGKSVINFELVEGKIAMTYQNMARLFTKDVNTIIEHVNNIFNDGELDKNSLARKFQAKLDDGRMKDLWHFDLKVVLAVGMRVSSQEGTIFRQWAIEHLHGMAVDGYSIDGRAIQNDPRKFNSLYTAVKKIRAEENLSWMALLKQYKSSIDFQHNDLDTRLFVATVQNKLHYAVHGHTASELIYTRADHKQPALGLLSCSGDTPLKRDIYVAKNYMTEDELSRLDVLVRRVLDFASSMSQTHRGVSMQDWMVKLNGILELSDRPVLMTFSKIKRKDAINKASLEFFRYVHEMQSKPNCPYPPNGQLVIMELSGARIAVSTEIHDYINHEGIVFDNDATLGEVTHELLCILVDSFHSNRFVFSDVFSKNLYSHDYFLQFPEIDIFQPAFTLTMQRVLYQVHAIIKSNIPINDKHFTLSAVKIDDTAEVTLNYI
jgi:hypothetical protein